VLGAIGAFESAKQWLLYASLDDALGRPGGAGTYLRRGENLRALGATGNAIALGYVMAVAMGFLLYLKKAVPNPLTWGLGLALLGVGLVSPLSRGPWVGAAAIMTVFIATGRFAGQRLAILGMLSVIVVTVLLASPLGETIIAHLPFVGTIDERNVAYRQRLMEISIQVIMQNPFFGETTFRQASELQVLRQGQGIIDVVNTYLRVGMESGLVGLSLFAGFFIAVAASIFTTMRRLPGRDSELHLLGQGILSTLLGILIIIFTVSSVSIIPVIYWSVAGAGVAYAAISRVAVVPHAAGSPDFQPAPTARAVRPRSRNH
jgi:O-antigen ligase